MGVVILIAFAFQVHVLITFWLLEAPLVGTFCIIGYIKGVVDRVNFQVTVQGKLRLVANKLFSLLMSCYWLCLTGQTKKTVWFVLVDNLL